MTGQGRSAPQTGRYSTVSMSLLTSLLARPLDPGYEAAARRRAAEGPTRRALASTIVLVLIAGLLGALTRRAALTPRATQPAVLQARAVPDEEATERSPPRADAPDRSTEPDAQ